MVKWDLKLLLKFTYIYKKCYPLYQRSWFNRDCCIETKFAVRVSCQVFLSLLVVRTKWMDAFGSDYTPTEVWCFPALWRIVRNQSGYLEDIRSDLADPHLGSGKWHVTATFQTFCQVNTGICPFFLLRIVPSTRRQHIFGWWSSLPYSQVHNCWEAIWTRSKL